MSSSYYGFTQLSSNCHMYLTSIYTVQEHSLGGFIQTAILNTQIRKPSPSINGAAHAQFAEVLHFSAFHFLCRCRNKERGILSTNTILIVFTPRTSETFLMFCVHRTLKQLDESRKPCGLRSLGPCSSVLTALRTQQPQGLGLLNPRSLVVYIERE